MRNEEDKGMREGVRPNASESAQRLRNKTFPPLLGKCRYDNIMNMRRVSVCWQRNPSSFENIFQLITQSFQFFVYSSLMQYYNYQDHRAVTQFLKKQNNLL